MKTLKTIYVDLNDKQSIKKAKTKKIELENNGYELISEDVGCLTARFTYKKG